MKKTKNIDRYAMMRLDWTHILDKAIKNRPLSWHKPTVREWRNASDEICFAVIREMEEKGLIVPFAPIILSPKKKKK